MWTLSQQISSACVAATENTNGEEEEEEEAEGIKGKAFYLLPSWIVDESLDSGKAQ